MSDDRDKRLEELFHLASDLPAGEREEFVQRHCAGDAELSDQLLALLEQDDNRTSTFLAGSAMPEAAAVGHRIGRYTLVQLLGAGGMGSVYLARQEEPVQREVALKMIHPGLSSDEIAQRFEIERQTLALMDHSGIAKMYDGGATESGQPYFVMEYVRGLPLTEFCDRHRLSTRARLKLFCRVCNAVQHAHQKAVIHRDLKPGNVLVTEQDGDPVPKIIDFGIARAVAARPSERALSTTTGGVVGTLLYMSPEQADPRGTELDTRTDIYSLGVILYELLAGMPPFDVSMFENKGFVEAQRILREQDPPVPSARVSTLAAAATSTVASQRSTSERQLPRVLSGELDWITMKALEKDRNRRYATAAELQADIERYLGDEPVHAGPPTLSYRMRKFVRRHRVAVSVSAILLVSLVGGVVATSLAWLDANAARQIERELRVQVEAEHEKARAIVEFLNYGLFRGAPVMAGKERTVRELLDLSSPDAKELFRGNPAGEAEVRSLVGRAYLELGEFEPAEAELRRAYAVQLSVTETPKVDLWATVEYLIRAIVLAKGEDAAAPFIAESNKLVLEILGQEHPELRERLVEMLALLRKANPTGEEAEQRLGAVMEAYAGVADREPLLRMMGRIVATVGTELLDRWKLPEAKSYFSRIESEARAVLDHDDVPFLTILALFANAYARHGDFEEALRFARELVERSEGVVPPAHWLFFEGDRVKGVALAGLENWTEAEQALVTVYDGIERLPRAKTLRMRKSQQGLGELCRQLLEHGHLESFLSESWRRFETREDGETHEGVWWVTDAAIELPSEAATIAVQLLERAVAESSENLRALAMLALAQQRAGKRSEASQTLRRLEADVSQGASPRDRALLERVRRALEG